eukprot:403333235
MQRLNQLNNHFVDSQSDVWVLKNIVPHEFKKLGDLKGKTLFITGASRGVGLAIGLRAARDGANVAIAAKTVTPNPKLEGTIYTAAEEIEKAGGKCLPISCDIRDEKSVRDALEQTAKHFGGIDIIVNNASALYLNKVEETDMKRFDLGMSVNTRGTFLVSKLAIPYLRKSKNAHILTISPPLSEIQNPINWFAAQGTGYVTSKFAMSMITHGLSGDLKKDGIACNTLWPRTMVASAAVKNLLGGEASIKKSRSPEIIAEAAHIIFTSDSKTTTGKNYIDDEVVASVHGPDMTKYRINKEGREIDLFADFLV